MRCVTLKAAEQQLQPTTSLSDCQFSPTTVFPILLLFSSDEMLNSPVDLRACCRWYLISLLLRSQSSPPAILAQRTKQNSKNEAFNCWRIYCTHPFLIETSLPLNTTRIARHSFSIPSSDAFRFD
jgi:hypothetical protein